MRVAKRKSNFISYKIPLFVIFNLSFSFLSLQVSFAVNEDGVSSLYSLDIKDHVFVKHDSQMVLNKKGWERVGSGK